MQNWVGGTGGGRGGKQSLSWGFENRECIISETKLKNTYESMRVSYDDQIKTAPSTKILNT